MSKFPKDLIHYAHSFASVTRKLQLENQRIPSIHGLLAEIKASATAYKLASEECIHALALIKVSDANNACTTIQRMWKMYTSLNVAFMNSQLELYKNLNFHQVLLSLQRSQGESTDEGFFSPAGSCLNKRFVFGMKQRYELLIFTFNLFNR